VRADAAPIPATASALSDRDVAEALAWQRRRLEYVDAPLSEIIADFNRYNQHRLIIADPALASSRFGGAFPAGDYDSLLQLLEKSFGVQVERRDRETVLRLPLP
jgi:transmembrane sensor